MGSSLCIRDDGNAILCCFTIFFSPFCDMTRERKRAAPTAPHPSLIPSSSGSSRGCSLRPTFLPFGRLKWIRYYLKAPFPLQEEAGGGGEQQGEEDKERKKKEECVHEISTEECLPSLRGYFCCCRRRRLSVAPLLDWDDYPEAPPSFPHAGLPP